jgi:hypothetical protein
MVLKEDILLDRKDARCVSYLSSGSEGLWCPCCGSKLRVNPRTQETEEEEEEEGLQCICLTLEKWESSLDLTETMAASCSKCEIEFYYLDSQLCRM